MSRIRCVQGKDSSQCNTMAQADALLAGSATGFIGTEENLINPANIRAGDAIIFFPSSGIHANGLTMIWDVIAPRLPDGYLTAIPNDDQTFGEAVLAPTCIYSDDIQRCQRRGARIHYAVNVTGHGMRKLMRAKKRFTYVIDKLPPRHPLFDVIQEYNPIGEKAMFGTFNMGAGYALYVAQEDVGKVLQGTMAFVAGHIEKGPKKVVIDPKGIEFIAEDLAIR